MFPTLKQIKKKLVGLTREHEALFSFVENNKHICTEKEKQKVQNFVGKVLSSLNSFMEANTSRKTCHHGCKILFIPCSCLQMLNRLTNSAELQARVDEEYFNINMEGHHMRLKWENTLKNCYQVEKNAFWACHFVHN